jgi:hypothetical protein
MGSFNNYTENKVLDHVVGKTSFTMPTAYVGLSTADPTDDASGLAEPSGNNYARVTTSGSDWDAASGGATANAAVLTFPEASGAWGTVTHFFLADASSGGNMLAHGTLDASRVITSPQVPRFGIGELDITLD